MNGITLGLLSKGWVGFSSKLDGTLLLAKTIITTRLINCYSDATSLCTVILHVIVGGDHQKLVIGLLSLTLDPSV